MSKDNPAEWNVANRNKKVAAQVDEFIERQRPKLIETRRENGMIVRVYEGR